MIKLSFHTTDIFQLQEVAESELSRIADGLAGAIKQITEFASLNSDINDLSDLKE